MSPKLFFMVGVSILAGCTHLDSAHSVKRASFETPKPAITQPPQPQFAHIRPIEAIDTQHEYQLAELIHLAQLHNPATRIAWQEAEQAALAAGMVKATYLPSITASVIAGRQSFHNQHNIELAHLLDKEIRSKNTAHGVVPALTLSWLLFDFGRRDAAHKAAVELSAAQYAKFTTAHQLIIFNVTRTYFEYDAARQKTRLAHEHFTQSKTLVQAAQARFNSGVGTRIDIAQAQQLQAQARLLWVQKQGAERDSYNALLGAMGLPPNTSLQVQSSAKRTLPALKQLPSADDLQAALAYRPDLMAADAVARAAEQGVELVKADYRPAVGLLAVAATGSASLNFNNALQTSPTVKGNAVFLGMTVPLYDGGLRRQRLYDAQSKAQAARDIFEQTQHAAWREIHIAANALRTALEAYEASQELLAAAQITHTAAQESYEVGLTSMMLATETSNALLDAAQAHATAHAAALIASSNLAFMMGQIEATDVLTQ
ncbi:TolC family protein [Paenalcaligenes hominis]|uniref:TolC family protein n=1 Tax=Paenalcaligenes hominis TaxID=643674 RepID=UPI0035249365